MNSWLAAVSVAVAPATVLALHLRRWHRDSNAVGDSFRKAEMNCAQTFKKLPGHWLHTLSAATLLALPFAQWNAYTIYQTSVAFLLPLAIAISVFLIGGVCRPSAVFLRPPDHREWAINGGLLAFGLGVAFCMPGTGATLVLRGALIDVLVMLVVSYGLRLHQGREQRPPSP